MKIIGVDDAGRGPVLGPMSLAGVLVDAEEEQDVLKELGAKDSKLLTPHKRKQIAEQVKFKYKYKIENATPKEIDDFPNLNHLEAVKAGLIINYLMDEIPTGEKVKVIVDAPSINAVSWAEYLMQTLVKKDQIELYCEHKADFKYPVVSAASIIAKENREDNMKALRKKTGAALGSGYPSDPRTKEFLAENWDKPEFDDIIRKSWSTYKKLADKGEQQTLAIL